MASSRYGGSSAQRSIREGIVNETTERKARILTFLLRISQSYLLMKVISNICGLNKLYRFQSSNIVEICPEHQRKSNGLFE
jgi:hypothetical protein